MAAPVTKGEELELDVESLAFGGNGVARLDGFVVFVRARAARRPRARAGHEGQAEPCRGARDRGPQAGAGAGRGAVRPLPRLRRLPLPGSRLRGAARAEGDAGARRAAAARGHGRAAARADPPVRAGDLPLPQQARVLVHRDARGAGARLPPGRPLGRGARDRDAAGSPTSSATGSATRSAPGRARRGSSRTRRPTGAATSATSSCGKAATPARRSSSS